MEATDHSTAADKAAISPWMFATGKYDAEINKILKIFCTPLFNAGNYSIIYQTS